ncbi:methyl-accepting chemotaxis protein [Pseudomonas cichorii]|nr:methyl-accepting chemotaxis protein [Pseudomonas cichorii]MBX8474106.1 methyl-accepting chemotaxis protein [Pseudomonas cichorii]GFM49010.1 methyl-accepting chemotaxis protein [Pseudomonas cichorii]
MNIRSMSIARRAALCFSVITFILVALGVFSYFQIENLRGAEQNIEKNTLPSIQTIDDIQIELLHARLESIRMLATSSPDVQKESIKKIEQAISKLESGTEFYKKNLLSGEEDRAGIEKSATLLQDYINGVRQIISLSASNPEKALSFANNEQVQRAENYQSQLSILRNQNSSEAVKAGEDATQIYSHSINVLLSIVVIAFILTVVLALTLTKSIVAPVVESLGLAEGIAKGDLTQKLNIKGSDEISRLMHALNAMADNLRKTIQEISGASIQLSTAAVEMTSITESADRTLQQQNSEVEQAATAVTEMSAAVEEVARNATSTSEAAKQSSVSANEGNRKVSETLLAMQDLTHLVENSSAQVQGLAVQAQNINKVVSVIRAIAEQTNLLALNAAIEAARAGEQGRGFAVVADEVRALAHRTQVSTQEIEQMISTIQTDSAITVESMKNSTLKVYSTQKTAEDAGASLLQITTSVLEINDRNHQIAAASEEQSHVAREVDKSLISIRELSIQSGEGARQTLAASNELSTLAINLNHLVGRFKV